LLKCWSRELSPPHRGGVAARSRKRCEASLARADGVVFNLNKNSVEFDHHPVRSIKDASRYFVEVAATPPRGGGESGGTLGFGNNPERPLLGFTERAWSRSAAKESFAATAAYVSLVCANPRPVGRG